MLYQTDGGVVNGRGDFSHDGTERALGVFLSGGNLSFRWSGSRRCGLPPGRQPITKFSEWSAGRMRRYLRSCLAEYTCMVTLTYPCGYPSDGRTVKGHLRAFMERCRRKLESRNQFPADHSAFWFLEFQGRGAPHFHIFTTFGIPRDELAQDWFEIVGSEDDRHRRAGTRIEALQSGRGGTVSYASKYAAKPEQKDVPDEYQNVGRFWGVCFNRRCVSAVTRVLVRDDDTQPRVRRALSQVKRRLSVLLAERLAVKVSRVGQSTHYIIRDINEQLHMQGLIRSLAFAYVVENGVGSLCTPLPDDPPYGHEWEVML